MRRTTCPRSSFVRLLGVLLICGLNLLVFGENASAQQAKVTLHGDRNGPAISPTLYGIFFEEVNLAGDGGLYGELVRNRSLEDSFEPDHWSLVAEGSTRGEILVSLQRPMSAKNPRSLQLRVDACKEGERVGAANEGYFGVPVQKDAVYDLSLAACSADGLIGPLTVTLEDAAGQHVYAKAQTEPLTNEWKTYRLTLTADQTDPKARLVVSASQLGTAWIDMVSLFPKNTWKGRPNGLRPELAGMLEALKPAFVRFPGGCWVEGELLQYSLRWKTTIGDLAERRTQWNLWRYHSTNGLGYHEYLQLCEDLGAEPLFVVNCGMSHAGVVPMDQLDEWVQDALDAIEYANGPADSKWGALRAKAGHPEPFHLKYLEIGNENSGPAYDERYAVFYDAVKAKYPEMRIVANVMAQSRPTEILDEHYYNSPEFFINSAARYDNYDRKGPKVYVGEYAVTSGGGQGSMRAAVGEAAFMTGMERNSDVVVMSSYAPLFANVNWKKWNPDLINFDGSRVYGTPSYYVQQMFSRNRGDVVVPVTVESPIVNAAAPAQGAIALGTWATEAEFKDIKVTHGDKVLFAGEFSKGLDGWKPLGGKWQVTEGVLRQASRDHNCQILVGDPNWTDYTIELKARKLSGAEGFLIACRMKDNDNKTWWNLGGFSNQRHSIEWFAGGGRGTLGIDVPGRIETGRWYDIRVAVEGSRLRCYLDGKLLKDVTFAPPPQSLSATASRETVSGDLIVKVVNVSTVPLATKIRVEGIAKIAPTIEELVLQAADPNDENSLDAPTKVCPQAQVLNSGGREFDLQFPANSVTILRLRQK